MNNTGIHSTLVVAVSVLLATLDRVPACGPDFPPTILDRADECFRTMPEANFAAELRDLLPAASRLGLGQSDEEPAIGLDAPWLNTVRADVMDLAAALRESALVGPDVDRRVAAYRVFRVLAGGYEPMLASWTCSTDSVPASLPPDLLEPPAGLPRDFERYAKGVVAYRLGHRASARDWWRAVFELPPKERRYKSTWAAYMLGRTQPEGEEPVAAAWYQLTRALAAAGYHDSLGLAAESLGWEAQLELRAGRFEQAAALYLEQYGEGDRGAVASLQTLVRRLLAAGPDCLEAAAGDVRLQRVVTAYLVSRAGPESEAAAPEEAAFWLAALARRGQRAVSGADRLAWLAYEEGDFSGATHWLTVACTNSLTARWLDAKLSLRRGDRVRAQAIFEGLVGGLDAGGMSPSFTVTERDRGQLPGSQAAGELAALLMSDGRYPQALDLLLRHGWWTDSAYVAERVLSTDELRVYVDRAWPVQPPDAREPGGWWDSSQFTNTETTAYAIRYLLGRRLAREGHGAEAAGYYPFRWRDWLRQYEDCLVRGREAWRTPSERATRLWRAARLMRYLGMELFGTETEPDWREWDGAFDTGEFGKERTGTNGPVMARVGADEAARVRQHGVAPEKRYHYRYLAADLAWEAASLMPDDAAVTADVLCEAGTWLKQRDPKAADRFYKALVRRCGQTDLGRAAAKLRWFPPVTLQRHSADDPRGGGA